MESYWKRIMNDPEKFWDPIFYNSPDQVRILKNVWTKFKWINRSGSKSNTFHRPWFDSFFYIVGLLKNFRTQEIKMKLNFHKNRKFSRALHPGFEFPTLSMYANSALSSFVDVSKVFYIHQSWSGITKNASQWYGKAIKEREIQILCAKPQKFQALK